MIFQIHPLQYYYTHFLEGLNKTQLQFFVRQSEVLSSTFLLRFHHQI